MCPDKQLLSAYCDGEVLSPWKARMEAHLAECGPCRAVVNRYRALGRFLRSAPPGAEEPMAFLRVRGAVGNSPLPPLPLWSKRISLPFAVAASLLFFAGGLALSVFAWPGPRQDVLVDGRQSTEAAANIADIKDMKQLLDILREDSERVIITLPGERGFQSYGKPIFLRAEDTPGGRKP